MTEPMISNSAIVLLARLTVPAKTPATEASLRKAVDALAGPMPPDKWDAITLELINAGYADRPLVAVKPAAKAAKKPKPLKAGPLQLTNAGRQAAQRLLAIDSLAAASTWKGVISDHLFPMTVPAAARSRVTDNKRLGGYLLAEAMRVDCIGDEKAVIDRAVLSDLGYPSAKDWPDLIRLVMSKRLHVELPEMKPADLIKQIPRIVFDLPDAKPDKLRLTRLKRWAAETVPAAVEAPPPPRPTSLSTDDLPAFARAVHQTTADPAVQRFGDNKVFISRLFDCWTGGDLTLEQFKQKLIESHRARLLTLSRADLVSAMNPEDVRRSKATYLNAEFHFVLIEPGERS